MVQMKLLLIIMFGIAAAIIQPVPAAGTSPATGQQADSVQVNVSDDSFLIIKGSSTLHNWEVEATSFQLFFTVPDDWFLDSSAWSGSEVELLELEVPVADLDGGRGKMNRDLREALRFDEHKQIRFVWDTMTLTGPEDGPKRAKVSGSLTIAGVTREISFEADMALNREGNIRVEGSVEIDMTDYNVDPPKALFGAIRTSKDVVLEYNLELIKEDTPSEGL